VDDHGHLLRRSCCARLSVLHGRRPVSLPARYAWKAWVILLSAMVIVVSLDFVIGEAVDHWGRP
jgi:hypothetical protein